MESRLTQEELELLMLYYRQDKGESNMAGLITKKDPQQKLLKNLVENGYINGFITRGKQERPEEEIIELNYQINGYSVSDYAIKALNLDLPSKE